MKTTDFLTELSTDKLAQYKTAAAADASKADKEKDFTRGNKRFSGIVKATNKQFDNDAKSVKETVGIPYPGTYEETNDMFKSGGQRRVGTLTTEEGVAEGSEQISEYRDRLLQYVKSLLPNYPEYVLKDWLVPNKGDFSNLPDTDLKNGIMEKLKLAGLTPNTKWQLVPDMKFTMDMFEPKTKQLLIGRAGGSSDLGMGIPRDKERHATQAALAQQQGGVRKEPVLLIKSANGYELLEGWHRTIQHFVMYPNGYTGPAYVAVAQGQPRGVTEGSKTPVVENTNQAAVDALIKKHGWSMGRTVNGDLAFTWQGSKYVFYGERMRITLPDDRSISVVWGQKPDWQGRGTNELSFAQAVQKKLLTFDLPIWQALDRGQLTDSQAIQKFKAENERQAREAVAQGQQGVAEGWSQKYKKSINCSHPKGFSQKAHCAGKKKHNESVEMEMVCEDCGMCETHGDHENLDEACWKGYHKEGNKKMFGKTYPNEDATDVEKNQPNILNLLRSWRNPVPAKYAWHLTKTFGDPHDATHDLVVWHDKDGFKRIEVKDEYVMHTSPAPHYDYLYCYIDLKVPHRLSSALADCSESILIDHLKNEVGARCASLAANAVTLNFVMDVIAGRTSPTRKEYERRIMHMHHEFENGKIFTIQWWPDQSHDTDPANPYYRKQQNFKAQAKSQSDMAEGKRIPRKPGQPANSKKHSDLYTDENPKGTITGLKFATPEDARASVSKIRNSGRSHAHKIQAAVAMEQRARAAGKASAAKVYRSYINSVKKTNEQDVTENNLDKFKKYTRPVVKTEPKIERTTNPAGRTTDHAEYKVTTPTGEIHRYKSKKQAQEHFDSFGQQNVAEEKKPEFMKAGNMKPFKASGEEIPGAVHTLEKLLLKAKERDMELNYTNIDKMMQAVCKKHNLTGDELHNEFVEKNHMIPDDWIVKQLDEACWDTHKQVGMKNKGGKQVPNCVLKESVEEQHSDSCPHCGGEMVSEELMNEKKDACYYKVKSRYSVWPSAYASGALVKCRKKGAANWGNGGKKNESSILEGIERADESLHDWFTKEKWVRMDTKGNIKGPCAREPGEGKPKCLPQAKAHSLGKKGRASAAARKRREDPNPDRSGKAINVNTKKETKE